jgi:subtilisin family serine protease
MPKKIIRKTPALIIVSLVLLLFVFTFISATTQTADAGAWKTAVDPWVLQTAEENGQTEFLVFLSEQANLSAAADLSTKIEKGTFVYEQLSETAARTQPAVIAALEAQNVEYRPFWVANMIWVRGNAAIVQAMAERDDVSHIYANPTVKADLPTQEEYIEQMQAIEWNILLVNADDVWGEGITGQGAVIGGQDTGYDWDHPASA